MSPTSGPAAADYRRLLERFSTYLERGWRAAGPDACYFGDPAAGENGLRSTGSAAFASALLATFEGSSDRARHLDRSRAALRYMTASHRTGAGRCAAGGQWGRDWQSSWWAAKMALGARLVWKDLGPAEAEAVRRVVADEADRHLERYAPTGLAEDTKAEENAWDAEILAAAPLLCPDHANATRWREKLIEFAANTFSCPQDRTSDEPLDGLPVRSRVYTCNLHSDFTLENHGSYHFCYVASPLQSIALGHWALTAAGLRPPEALLHRVPEVWRLAKSTFLDTRFAYVSGKDWARYTYGLYFIVPALALIQHRFRDADARAIESRRFRTLEEEQAASDDGSFFGARLTRGRATGQIAKYETDCAASLGLAYLLHRDQGASVEETPPERLQESLSIRHVSPESGVAFVRTPRFFASFSWKTLSSPHPIALFIPAGGDDLAEWQPGNLLGLVDLGCRVEAVGVHVMVHRADGLLVEGILGFRNARGRTLYDQHLRFEIRPDERLVRVRSRFVARARLSIREAKGLKLSVANDRFNGFRRRLFSDAGEAEVRFEPRPGNAGMDSRSLAARAIWKLVRRFDLKSSRRSIGLRWVNIDDRLGIVRLGRPDAAFVVRQPDYRNVPDGSLHYDEILNPWIRGASRGPGEDILSTEYLLLAGTAEETRVLAQREAAP